MDYILGRGGDEADADAGAAPTLVVFLRHLG
jgi:hypothetical protein